MLSAVLSPTCCCSNQFNLFHQSVRIPDFLHCFLFTGSINKRLEKVEKWRGRRGITTRQEAPRESQVVDPIQTIPLLPTATCSSNGETGRGCGVPRPSSSTGMILRRHPHSPSLQWHPLRTNQTVACSVAPLLTTTTLDPSGKDWFLWGSSNPTVCWGVGTCPVLPRMETG